METSVIVLVAVGTVFLVVPLVVLFIAALFRHRKYPEKNFKFNLINTALTPIRALRLGPYKDGELSLDKSIKTAMKKAKLTDFGGSSFVNNYRIIMDADFHKAQKFTNLGYISARIELKMTWVRRLKFIQYLKEHPQILDTPVRSPVFVMGLPRSGTTYMHRLLSLDPKIRAPLLWELLHPVPAVASSATSEEMKKDRKQRRDWIDKLIQTRKSLGDRSLEHIHEVGTDLPEECIMALTDEVPVNLQFLYSNYMSQHEYLSIPFTPAYLHYKKVLQLLSFQLGEIDGAKRWVLKCPVHMFYTKEIATAFPDAKLVWTHRHPVSSVPSLCSLLKSVHQIYFEKEGRNDFALGNYMKGITADLLNKVPLDLAESKLPCVDVIYNSLIKDPIGAVKKIYAQYEWDFSSEYEKILEDYIEENRIERERLKAERTTGSAVLHTYEPEEFGLTEKDLSTGGYTEYITKYSLPMSKN